MTDQLPFFVYGTLLPGQPNYHVWGDAILWAKPAKLRHVTLFDMGYYPMLVETGEGAVRGEIVAVRPDAYKALLERLDRLEGYDEDSPEIEAYFREKRTAMLKDGREVQTWVYLGLPRLVKDQSPIIDGSWLACAAAKGEAYHAWWHDVSSVAGLHETKE